MVVRDAVCLVTGASSGIGRATAIALARRGARVVVTGRHEERLAEVARSCGGRWIAADLEQRDEIDRVVAAAGPVDLLVNNAGVAWAGPTATMEPEAIEHLVRVNVLAPALLVRAVLPSMLERGRGHVVNVASIAGHLGVRNEAVYAATKAALVTFTESLQQELHRTPVRVTLVSPGVIDTPLFERRGAPYGRRFPRPVGVERMARAIVEGIERDAALVLLPRWLALPIRLHGLAPSLYRRLAARWG